VSRLLFARVTQTHCCGASCWGVAFSHSIPLSLASSSLHQDAFCWLAKSCDSAFLIVIEIMDVFHLMTQTSFCPFWYQINNKLTKHLCRLMSLNKALYDLSPPIREWLKRWMIYVAGNFVSIISDTVGFSRESLQFTLGFIVFLVSDRQTMHVIRTLWRRRGVAVFPAPVMTPRRNCFKCQRRNSAYAKVSCVKWEEERNLSKFLCLAKKRK